MAKKKITEIVADELLGFTEENELELYNCEYTKEGRDWFLNVYIDRPQDKEELGIGTDECEKVSRYLSDRLDSLDLIEKNYYLVVSSPGMDRELVTEEHYKRYVGREVDVKLYKGFEGSKKYRGVMVGVDSDTLTLEQEGKRYGIPRELVAKTRLAIVF